MATIAHRTKRPWQGAVEPPALERREKYEKECYLCPGNMRAGGLKTDVYEETFVFEVSLTVILERKKEGEDAKQWVIIRFQFGWCKEMKL